MSEAPLVENSYDNMDNNVSTTETFNGPRPNLVKDYKQKQVSCKMCSSSTSNKQI